MCNATTTSQYPARALRGWEELFDVLSFPVVDA
jgi:hypothetical protein